MTIVHMNDTLKEMWWVFYRYITLWKVGWANGGHSVCHFQGNSDSVYIITIIQNNKTTVQQFLFRVDRPTFKEWILAVFYHYQIT